MSTDYIPSYQKTLEFNMPWILKQFKLPKGLVIRIFDSIEPTENGECLGFYRNESYPIIAINGGHFDGKENYEILCVLAHELKHAEQWLEKKLQIVQGFHDKRQYRWENREDGNYSILWYKLEDNKIMEKYWNFPWEVEAREAENNIFRKWLEKHYSFNIFRMIRWMFFKPKNISRFEIL